MCVQAHTNTDTHTHTHTHKYTYTHTHARTCIGLIGLQPTQYFKFKSQIVVTFSIYFFHFKILFTVGL